MQTEDGGDDRRAGGRQVEQAALFYQFSIERHVPQDHPLRAIDRFVDLSEVRRVWHRPTSRWVQ